MHWVKVRNLKLIHFFQSGSPSIYIIAWPSLIPDVVAHRKPRWWRSNSLIRLWFLYFPHWGGLYIRNVCGNRQFWHFSKLISWIVYLIFYYQVSRITNDFSVYLCGFFIQFITSVQRYTYVRFLMKNLIRSKEEAEIAKKTHGKALLEQFFSQTPKEFTSNSLHEVSFAGRSSTHKFSSWMNAVLQQHDSHFQSEKWDSWEQRCSTVFINYIFC